MSGVGAKSNDRASRAGPTEASAVPEVPPVLVMGKGFTPAHAPSEMPAAATQRRNNTVDRMQNPRGPRIPAAL